MKAAENGFDRRQEIRRYWGWLAVGISVVVCLEWNRVDVDALFNQDGLANASSILGGFLQPNLSLEFLQRILLLSFESLFVGILGTIVAVIVGTSLALVAIRLPELPDPPGRRQLGLRLLGNFIRWFARFLLGFLRSIPEVVWAYLFVRMLGLGPGAAVLAIGLTVGGSIGKLYAELGEAANRHIVGSLRASGARRWAIILFSIIPQVLRQWVAYALFRMECNIRMGTILGVVGAGGLGTEIVLSIRYFEYDKLATTLMAVLFFVILLEMVSAWLRQRHFRWALGFAVLGGTASFIYLDVPWVELFRGAQMLPDVGEVTLSPGFIENTAWLTLETLSMAWVATIAAAVLAFLLAPLATRHLYVTSYLDDTYRKSGVARILPQSLLSVSRLFLQVSRAMPELTLALIFVVWVGPGAFAGILAIAFHNIGVIGRLYTDVYEEVEPGPARAMQASGAGPLGVWLFAVLPQVVPRLAAFTLYRFEVNIRATAMVGFVGAGGIGDALHTAISLFQFADLAVLLAVMILVVTAVDYVGDRVRHRILVGKKPPEAQRQNPVLNWIYGEQRGPETDTPSAHQLPPDCPDYGLYYRVSTQDRYCGAELQDLTLPSLTLACAEHCPQALVVDLFVRTADGSGFERSSARVRSVSSPANQSGALQEQMLLELIRPTNAFLEALCAHAKATGARIGTDVTGYGSGCMETVPVT